MARPMAPMTTRTLFSLDMEPEATDNTTAQTQRPRVRMHPRGISAVCTAPTRLQLITHASSAKMDATSAIDMDMEHAASSSLRRARHLRDLTNQVGEDGARPTNDCDTVKCCASTADMVAVTLAHRIVDVAFSRGGAYVAVADDAGELHLYKKDGALLFAYPVVQSDGSDGIAAIGFATSDCDAAMDENAQDLIVLTRLGLLLRLGKLQLAEVERLMVATPNPGSDVFQAIRSMIHVQHAQLSPRSESLTSVLLARTFSTSLYVFVGNHDKALSVWQAKVPSASSNRPLQRFVEYDVLPCGGHVRELQLVQRGRVLVVLSTTGILTWWDWRTMTCLFDLDAVGIQSFCVDEAIDCRVFITRVVDNNATCATEVHHISSQTQREVEVSLLFSHTPSAQVVLSQLPPASQQAHSTLCVTTATFDHIKATAFSAVASRDSTRQDQANSAPVHDDSDVLSVARSLATMDISMLSDAEEAREAQAKIHACEEHIGQNLEESQQLIHSLVEMAVNIRHYIASTPMAGLPSFVMDWCNTISSLSYKWTTFQLLLSTKSADSRQLRSRWLMFSEADMLEIMQRYLKKGSMRAVRILWQRHARDEAVRQIDSVLNHVPMDLPLNAYEKWVQADVLPAIVDLVEHTADGETSRVVQSFVDWLLLRVQYAASRQDIESARRLCNLLRVRAATSATAEVPMKWTAFRLRLCLQDDSRKHDNDQNAFDRLDVLTQHLDHIHHLDLNHRFKISLSMFEEETPSSIALSMLDRVVAPELFRTEIEDHVKPYLQYCGVNTDDVLREFLVELVETSPTLTTVQQGKALAVVDEIEDLESKAEAVLMVLGSMIPPFSLAVKEYARTCLSWDTKQADAIREHIRLMEIQDMLMGYGIRNFKMGDAPTGSRLVWHILSQLARESAFGDALRLVDAYSHLSCERAAVRYFENLLAFGPTSSCNEDQEIVWRVEQVKRALIEIRRRKSSAVEAYSIILIMEETIQLGLFLLEEQESAQDGGINISRHNGKHLSGQASFMLRMLEAMVEVFLAEAKNVEHSAQAARIDAWESIPDAARLLTPSLLSDLHKLRKIDCEWGMVVSITTLRDPDRVAALVDQAMIPEKMFSTAEEAAKKLTQAPTGRGKGKKRAGSSNESQRQKWLRGVPDVKVSAGETTSEEQQDDSKVEFAFALNRFASSLGINAEVYHSLVAQRAAKSGDILSAVQFSRDLFSRRRGRSNIGLGKAADVDGGCVNSSAVALRNIALSISEYTAVHADVIYAATHTLATLTPVQVARMRAPMYSLELLRYSICVCDADSLEDTLVSLKIATLLDEVLRFLQFPSYKATDESEWRIYDRWFREDTCVLPSAETMKLATRFAIAEHQILIEHRHAPVGVIQAADSKIPASSFIPSKAFVSFLVENGADLLSIVMLQNMRHIPDEAGNVVQSQLNKLLSTVFQSQRIDARLALGLMLSVDQRDAFNGFKRQITRENVAKDFSRFEQLARIGADAARAWQQIAFLHQCVELEGNARWWHYLNLLGIECEHKAFQSEKRDLNYIRSLVPSLLSKSNNDYYTILEFTRHYQIDDSFPALVYVEALLLEDSTNLEYQDKIVGVLDDIHDQQLTALLLKTLGRIPGTDYERLLFVLRTLLERTSYRETEEVERRMEILHVLKAFATSQAKLEPREEMEAPDAFGDAVPMEVEPSSSSNVSSTMICFHRLLSNPNDVLSEVLSTRTLPILANLRGPLLLEPDEMFMQLLRNVVSGFETKREQDPQRKPTSVISSSELQRLFEILSRLSSHECQVTGGEWLAEHLPLSEEKLQALEFALRAISSSEGGGNGSADGMNSTFTGLEAVARLETKILRTKLQLIFREASFRAFCTEEQEAALLKLLPTPKQLFTEVYRQAAVSSRHAADNALHAIADQVAAALRVPGQELRCEMVRELLLMNAVHGRVNPANAEDIFQESEEERRDVCDSEMTAAIVFIALKITEDEHHSLRMMEDLVKFAKEARPRPGVTFRAKLRAAQVILQLAQSHRALLSRAVEEQMQLAEFDVFVRELVEYIRHCRHMISFEENRVPFEIGYVMRTDKESLARSLLRQHASDDSWVLRCVANLMLDFSVAAQDLWTLVLSRMHQKRMIRSLSRILRQLSDRGFVRAIEGASKIWEATMLSPLLHLKHLISMDRKQPVEDAMQLDLHAAPAPADIDAEEFQGIPLRKIEAELETMVLLLQQCPFLDQIDVGAFVVHLRDLTESASEGGMALQNIDLQGCAVRCAMVIPRPHARKEALLHIIRAGAYMQVLVDVCGGAAFLGNDHRVDESGWQEDDELDEHLLLLHEIFTEASKRGDHAALLQSSFQQSFLEFLATTGNIDQALAILLSEKRLEAASTLVEMYFEEHPSAAPADWKDAAVDQVAPSAQARWMLLQEYLTASSSPLLSSFRQQPQA